MAEWLEGIWTNRWSGVVFAVLATVTAAYLFYWIPPPGVSVAVMGLVAAVMSLRTGATGREKATWMLIISALLVVEFGAIKKDRYLTAIAEAQRVGEERHHFSDIGEGIKTAIAESDTNFNATMQRSEALMKLEHNAVVGLRENLRTSTGGDSFCYADLLSHSARPSQVIVVCAGKYPLYDLGLRVFDATLYEQTKDMARADVLVASIGNMAANTARALPQSLSFSGMEKQDFNVFFGARNGFWTELLRYRKVKGNWEVARLVESFLNPRYAKGAVVYRVVDKDFPIGELKQDKDWQRAGKLPQLKNKAGRWPSQ